MEKYKTLDNAVLAKIGGQGRTFSAINVRDVRQECERIASEEGGRIEAFRILDRRLQALRKAGQIRSTPKGWVRAGSAT